MVAPAGGQSVDAMSMIAPEGFRASEMGGSLEEVLGDFDGGKIGDYEGDEHAEEGRWERCEAEGLIERALGDQSTDGHNNENRGKQWKETAGSVGTGLGGCE